METNERIEARFCPECGTPITPGTRFCINCGTKIALPEQTAVKQEAEVKPEAPVEAPAAPVEAPAAAPSEAPVEAQAAPAASVEAQAAPAETAEAPAENGFEAAEAPFTPAYNEAPAYAAAPAGQSVASNYADEMERFRERQAQYARGTYVPERKPDTRKGLPGWAAALIIIVTVLVIVGVFVLIGFFGYQIYKTTSNAVSGSKTSSGPKTVEYSGSTKVGDQTVPGGSNVTINITGDSTSLATAVYAKCKDSVVGIAIFYKSSSSPWEDASYSVAAEGSGVVYTADGNIITNAHVISPALDKNNNLLNTYEIRVYTDSSLSSYFIAEVVGIDYTSDLAVIKINANGLIPIEIESSKTVQIGDEVFVIGCPGGIEFMGSIIDGIVGGLNKNLLTSDGYAYDLIQTSAPINPGASGGAMVNREGKLVGICEMKIVETGYEGMEFAIASDTVKEVCDTLMKDGKVVRPAIGIKVNSYYDVLTASDTGLPAGAYIAEVEKDSVAGKAGLKADMIITEFNGVAVYNFVSLRAEIMKCQIGDEVTVKAYVYDSSDKAGGTYKTFTLNLQSMEDEYREFE